MEKCLTCDQLKSALEQSRKRADVADAFERYHAEIYNGTANAKAVYKFIDERDQALARCEKMRVALEKISKWYTDIGGGEMGDIAWDALNEDLCGD